MKFPLEIEDIHKVGEKSKAWVAAVSWCNGLKRDFLTPSVDYSKGNSVGSRGVRKYFWLDDNGSAIYEVSAPETWKHTDRYFCTVRNQKIIRLEHVEAIGILQARSTANPVKALGQALQAMAPAPENMQALAKQAEQKARDEALRAKSDPDVPAEIVRAANICSIDTGVTVTAIKRTSTARIMPARPVDNLCDWQCRRMIGRLTPRDPEPKEVVDEGWGIILIGNAVSVENWMKDNGFSRASALGPNYCFVGEKS